MPKNLKNLKIEKPGEQGRGIGGFNKGTVYPQLEKLKGVQKIKKSSSALWCRGRLSPNAREVRFLTHGIAVHFERRAAAAEIDAVAEEVLTAERKPDTHRVLKCPSEATGVVLTVTVSPHRGIEHRG